MSLGNGAADASAKAVAQEPLSSLLLKVEKHGVDHASKGGMLREMYKLWFTVNFSKTAHTFCENCVICAQNNISKGHKMQGTSAHQPTSAPFQHVMMDFIELTICEEKILFGDG